MAERTHAPSAPSSGLPSRWQLGRIAVGFYIDLVEISREGGDVLSPLLLAAVIEANVANINHDPALQVTYLDLDTPPPDQLRRPVSMNALAASLGLPFETVRRRLRQLQQAGRCETGPRGVVVPSAALSTPEYVRLAILRYERLKRLYRDIDHHIGLAQVQLELERPAEPTPLRLDPARPPIRLCNRLIGQYALRLTEVLVPPIGDAYAAFLLLNIVRAGIRTLPLDEAAAGQALEPQARAAVRPSKLAEVLALPPETVRRHLAALQTAGYLDRVDDGFAISAAALKGPVAHGLVGAAAANAVIMFQRLRRFGVLALWDGEAEAQSSSV
jgi:DNA-binding Lrp family transcriptional regulator